jgi:uncharacterized membrane protein
MIDSCLTSKKGQETTPLLLAGISILLALLFFSIVSIFVNNFIQEFNADIQASDLSTEAKLTVADMEERFPQWMDNAFLILFGLFYVLGLVASYYADSNAWFLIIDVILIVLLFVASMYFSNLYDSFITEDGFTSFSIDFPVTDWVMSHLLLVIIVMLLSFFVVIYYKNRLLT